jgi:hypothetical protein
MIYTVSYVVIGGTHPGAVISQQERPVVGAEVEIGGVRFQIVEVKRMLPPREDFEFLHATVRPVTG